MKGSLRGLIRRQTQREQAERLAEIRRWHESITNYPLVVHLPPIIRAPMLPHEQGQ